MENKQPQKALQPQPSLKQEIFDIRLIKDNMNEFYEVIGLISNGTSSKVYKVISQENNKIYACKVAKFNEVQELEIIIDYFIKIKPLTYSKLIQIYEIYIEALTNNVYIIMEYIDGVELFDFQAISNLQYDDDFIQNLSRQILLGVKFLHDHGIAHQYLKPSSILLYKMETGEFEIKILTFNVSKLFKLLNNDLPLFRKEDQQLLLQSNRGTIGMCSPEVFSVEKQIHSAADMWSFGCILFILYTGALPFGGDTAQRMIDNIKKADIVQSLQQQIPLPVLELIQKLLIVDRFKRFNVQAALQSDWFQANEQMTQQQCDQIFQRIQLNQNQLVSNSKKIIPKQIIDNAISKFIFNQDKNNQQISDPFCFNSAVETEKLQYQKIQQQKLNVNIVSFGVIQNEINQNIDIKKKLSSMSFSSLNKLINENNPNSPSLTQKILAMRNLFEQEGKGAKKNLEFYRYLKKPDTQK